MSLEETLRLATILVVWGAMLAGAIRLFGPRRVAGFFLLLILFGVAIAFRSLGVILGSGRRY